MKPSEPPENKTILAFRRIHPPGEGLIEAARAHHFPFGFWCAAGFLRAANSGFVIHRA
jgi:hypothetical protein